MDIKIYLLDILKTIILILILFGIVQLSTSQSTKNKKCDFKEFPNKDSSDWYWKLITSKKLVAYTNIDACSLSIYHDTIFIVREIIELGGNCNNSWIFWNENGKGYCKIYKTENETNIKSEIREYNWVEILNKTKDFVSSNESDSICMIKSHDTFYWTICYLNQIILNKRKSKTNLCREESRKEFNFWKSVFEIKDNLVIE